MSGGGSDAKGKQSERERTISFEASRLYKTAHELTTGARNIL